jgi:hypothetical protein
VDIGTLPNHVNLCLDFLLRSLFSIPYYYSLLLHTVTTELDTKNMHTATFNPNVLAKGILSFQMKWNEEDPDTLFKRGQNGSKK